MMDMLSRCLLLGLVLSIHDVGSFTFQPKTSLKATSFVNKMPTNSFTKKNSYAGNSNRNSNGGMSMLVVTSGGMEQLQEYTERIDALNPLTKTVRKSPAMMKYAGLASIPVSAVLGFGIVPSRRIAAHTVGAVVTGCLGMIGKSRIDAMTRNHFIPAIATLLIDIGIDSPKDTAMKVKELQQEYMIDDDEFHNACIEIYSNYFLGMIRYNSRIQTNEIIELEKLRTSLHMENIHVGEAHAQAAKEWYRLVLQEISEDELLEQDDDQEERMMIDKFLFLTERALSCGNESPEAFQFEMTRFSKIFNYKNMNVAMERIQEIIEPFYQRALKSTRMKLGTDQVDSGTLERARNTLGLSLETAMDMHVTAYNEEVRSLLGTDTASTEEGSSDEEKSSSSTPLNLKTAKFGEGAQERLEELRDVLSLTSIDAEYEIATEVTPLYQATAMSVMKDVLNDIKTPEDAWLTLESRRKELYLTDDVSISKLISSMIMQTLGEPLEACNKFAKVNNEAATYENLVEALHTKETLIAILLEKSKTAPVGTNTTSEVYSKEQFDEMYCNPWDKNSANGFLSTEDRIKLYRIFMTRTLLKTKKKEDDAMLTEKSYDEILAIKGLLGITDVQAEQETRTVFGPKLQDILQTATMEIVDDYTDELRDNMSKQITTVMENYRLSQEYLRELGASFYNKAVELISTKSPSGIPSEEQSKALQALRELYQLSIEETYTSHVENFGSIYKKSVLEAMGTTGVIREEFREPLEDLKSRLGVSDDATKQLFLDAVEEKMTPMVEWIESEMERTMLTQKQRSDRKGKDLGEDLFQTGKGSDGVLGLGAEVNIMSEIMNLVDFYNENNIVEEKETGTKMVEGEEGTVEEPVIETIYPVNALGSNMIDVEMAELLYRQFIVSSFTNQNMQGMRYENARDTFAGILGLEKFKIDEITDNIGNTVYDNFVGNAMKTKGSMDQQDMMVLANIQTKLGLTSEQSEKMLMQSQKKILSEEINDIMDSGSPTPEAVKAFREKCNSMGVDLVDDVGVSKARLTRLFECEIAPGLSNGEITAESNDLLVEVQDSLSIDPEECEMMFENTLSRLSKNAMDLTKSELLRGREENTVEPIKQLVRYAAFTGGELGLIVETAIAYQIFNIYEALDFTDEGDDEQIETNMDLLRKLLGLKA